MGPTQTPFVANDRGDVYIYRDRNMMYEDIEAADASKMDIFDAAGRPIRVVVEGYKWRLDEQHAGAPDPDRLAGILRGYFARLPAELADFSQRAAGTLSLEELIQLRIALSDAPSPGRWNKLFKRPWG